MYFIVKAFLTYNKESTSVPMQTKQIAGVVSPIEYRNNSIIDR